MILIGSDIAAIGEYLQTELGSILNTSVLFSISFFTLMSERGLFDPLVDFIVDKLEKISLQFLLG